MRERGAIPGNRLDGMEGWDVCGGGGEKQDKLQTGGGGRSLGLGRTDGWASGRGMASEAAAEEEEE